MEVVIPYIIPSRRKYWDSQFLFNEEDPDLTHPGTLNYLITRLVLQFVKSRGGEWSEDNLNSVYGALFCALLELDRRKKQMVNTIENPPETPSYTAYNDYIGHTLRLFLNMWSTRSESFNPAAWNVLDEMIRLYKTDVADYEQEKIKKNGDVY